MSAAYALLGLILGIAIDEAIRRFGRDGRRASPGSKHRAAASQTCKFVAQDFYDR